MSERVDGACLCGAVAFHIETPTSACVHCHCTMCQRNHGAAYVTWIALPAAQLTIDQGEERLVRWASSDHGRRTFCGACGTSLFCDSSERPGEVDIPLAVMKGPIDRSPQLHIFFSDRVPWVAIEDDLPRLGGATGLEPLAPPVSPVPPVPGSESE